MAVRFEGTSAGVKGTTYTVQVHDADYLGAVVDVDLDGSGFTLTYEPEEEEPDTNIIPSTLSFSIIREPTNASDFDAFLTEFIAADEERFTVCVLDGSSNLYWCGYLLADQVRHQDTRWADTVSVFAFKAKDGINRLKAIDYNNAGSPYTGRVTFKEHLFNILDKIGLQDFWGATDDYLHSIVRWYESSDATATLFDNSLDRVNADHKAAYVVGDSEEYKYLSSYEILKSICTIFGARFFQANGKYHFHQWSEYRETGDIYLHRYYKDRTKPGTTSSVSLEVDEVAGDFVTASQGVFGYTSAIRRYELEFKHRDDRNYAQGLVFNFETNKVLTQLPGTNSKYRIAGLLETDVLFTGAHLPVFCVVGLKIEVQDADGTVYRLARAAFIDGGGNPYYEPAEWVMNGAVLYEIVMPLQISGLPITLDFDFVTPDSPVSSDTARMTFTWFDVRQDVQGSVLGNSVDSVSINLTGLIIQAMNTDGTFPASSNLLSVSNPDSPNASEVLERETLFADTITFTSSGSITRTVSGEEVKTNTWKKGLTGSAYSLRRLLALEVIRQRKKPLSVVEAVFYLESAAHFYNIFKLSTGELFVPIRAVYNSKNEQFSGQYFNIGYDDTLTGVTPVVDIPVGPTGEPVTEPPTGVGSNTVPGVSAGNVVIDSHPNGGHIVSTTGTSTYDDGDPVTTIDIEATGVDGLIQSGDTIAMIDRTTGNTQNFSVTTTVGATDTSISVSSTTIDGSFGQNSFLTLGTDEYITNIQAGASSFSATRYVQSFNPASTINTVTENSGVLPASTNQIDVYYNGVMLTEIDDYTVSGSNINLTFSPSGRILVKFLIFT